MIVYVAGSNYLGSKKFNWLINHYKDVTYLLELSGQLLSDHGNLGVQRFGSSSGLFRRSLAG